MSAKLQSTTLDWGMPVGGDAGPSPMLASSDGHRLWPPPLDRDTVERTRLLTRLERARGRRVVLICAPAGFGKTIFAHQWVARDERAMRWLQLDRVDDDPVVLAKGLVAMLGGPSAVAPSLKRELASGRPRLEDLVLPALGRELSARNPMSIVLDDVEVITNPRSRAMLSYLVGAVPAGSQLVLVTRSDAAVPLARLRATGDLLDVRGAELAFDLQETRTLLSRAGLELSDGDVRTIRDRAEGWAAGIALALVGRDRQNRNGQPLPFSLAPSSEIARYLLEEAVERQAPDVQQFLLSSSVMRRMSPSLCDATLDIDHSAQLLADLEGSSMFVVALDNDGEWYRYHHLFRDVLQAELRRRTPDEVPRLLTRAAAWHEAHGDPGEGFEYAHACGDLARAGRIALANGEVLLSRGEIEPVRAWLDRCTAEELASDPQLALTGAWLALLTGRARETEALLLAAESAGHLDETSADGATSLRSVATVLRATLAPRGVSQMLRDGEAVCAAEAATGSPWLLHGWRAVGTAQLLAARSQDAITAFSEVIRLSRDHPGQDACAAYCLGSAALAAADAGDWRLARKWAREADAATTDGGLDSVLQSVAAYTAHAAVLAHDGLLSQAAGALEQARRLGPMLHAVRWLEADMSMRWADVSLDLGDVPAALDLADIARAALTHYPDPGRLPERIAALDLRIRGGSELGLTPSEQRILPFLSSHRSLQEIGDHVHLSRATVKTHAESVYHKLGVPSRSAAVERLDELGL